MVTIGNTKRSLKFGSLVFGMGFVSLSGCPKNKEKRENQIEGKESYRKISKEKVSDREIR